MANWFDRDDDRERYGRRYSHDRGYDYDRERYGRGYGYDQGYNYDREDDRWRYGRGWYGGRSDHGYDYDRGQSGGFYGERYDRIGEQWRGPYTGRGPRGYQRSDERIKEDVQERLTQHGQIDATDIEVEVNKGVVTLKGQVNNRWAKRLAEDVADDVFGVRDVYNQLHVKEEGIFDKIADTFS